MSDRLFIAAYPTGIVYADRKRERHGDYARCAFLSYDTLELEIEPDCPASLAKQIAQHAKKLQARSGKDFQVSQSGQTVLLGSRIGTQKPHSGTNHVAPGLKVWVSGGVPMSVVRPRSMKRTEAEALVSNWWRAYPIYFIWRTSTTADIDRDIVGRARNHGRTRTPNVTAADIIRGARTKG